MSGYRGVAFNKKHGKYRASVTVNWKRFHLGCFDDPEEAARVAAQARIEHYGEFAT